MPGGCDERIAEPERGGCCEPVDLRAHASDFAAQLLGFTPSRLRLGAGQLRVRLGGFGVHSRLFGLRPRLLGPSFELVSPAHGVGAFDGTAPQAEDLGAEVSRHEIEEDEFVRHTPENRGFGSIHAFGHQRLAERVTRRRQRFAHLHRHGRGMEMLVLE